MGDFVDKDQLNPKNWTETEKFKNFNFSEDQRLHIDSIIDDTIRFGLDAGYYKDAKPKTRQTINEDKFDFKFTKEQNEFLNKLLNTIYDTCRRIGEIDRKNEEFKDKTQNTITHIPNPQPRIWLLNEHIFIKGRENMITGDPGCGKGTFCREYSYRLWKKGYTILNFTQEDDTNEDIDPWLASRPEFKEGEKIERMHFFTDWTETPIEETLKKFRHIKDKFIIVDPVHSLFTEVNKPAKCREILVSIRDNCLAEGDTLVFVNHPKTMWKEFKMSASEINSSTKELSRFCRGVTILKLDKDTGLNILEHSKRQLNTNRYSFRVVLDHYTNKDNKLCPYSTIEDFQILKEDNSAPKAMVQTQNNLSKKEKILEKK